MVFLSRLKECRVSVMTKEDLEIKRDLLEIVEI